MNPDKTKKVGDFANRIRAASDNEVVEGTLATSERVLKRVTDGIYRQPSSALRELISNAYDADATLVEIQTDLPRFDQIIVRDDGNGLTVDAISCLIHNIGGSSKRTASGLGLGVCDGTNHMLSPGGRKLIGKIGIGLFSVSQLTKEFQIITKIKGEKHRTIADVVLHSYSEDKTVDPDSEFSTGTVKIWKVPATDTEKHGTEVVLRNLLQKTKDDLASKEMWLRCDPETTAEMEDVTSVKTPKPIFHIGRINRGLPDEIGIKPVLPWKSSDKSSVRFEEFVKEMYALRGRSSKNPSIHDHLDYYLRMLWTLGLSVPVDYVQGHPFDLKSEEGFRFFRLGNNKGDQVKEIELKGGQSIRGNMGLVSPERGVSSKFRVVVDGVDLFRPIPFKSLPKTQESVPYSLLFVGKDAPDLSLYPEEVRGGDLAFEAYLFWTHVVVPKEHAGILVRISDSNGVLFDPTFMDYPISELTRKRQVVAEVFVTSGLDAALNIDRESFNYSHPHYQYVSHWVHNAFRQFSNKHKAIGKEIRDKARQKATQHELDVLEQQVDKSLRAIISDDDVALPIVEFTDNAQKRSKRRKAGVLSLAKAPVFKLRPVPSKETPNSMRSEKVFEGKIKAVAKILDAYGVFEDMPYKKQEELLRDIVQIFSI